MFVNASFILCTFNCVITCVDNGCHVNVPICYCLFMVILVRKPVNFDILTHLVGCVDLNVTLFN